MAWRILCPCDGSCASRNAIGWLASHMDLSDISVTLLFVMVPGENPAGEEYLAQTKQRADQVLNDAKSYLPAHLPIHTAVRFGGVAEMIVRYAIDHDIDLIVLGKSSQPTRGLGSIALAVLQHSTAPVTIIDENWADR